MLTYEGSSPLKWNPRDFNKQADYLCHQTLEQKQSWKDIQIAPSTWKLQSDDYLVGWCDGGYDAVAGGSAGYTISVQRDEHWTNLLRGGIFDSRIAGNDSFRMEAIGMEQLLLAIQEYLVAP